jgi:hypothetical protein
MITFSVIAEASEVPVHQKKSIYARGLSINRTCTSIIRFDGRSQRLYTWL